MLEIEDNIESSLQGEVLMRVFDHAGRPHSDPLSVFLDRERAKRLNHRGHVVALDHNLVVNSGRQIIANLLGGRDYNDTTPNSDWIIKWVRFGTFDEAPRFTDTTLSPQPEAGSFVGGENTILYDGSNDKKLISAVDFPQPFVVRFEFSLGTDEANGQLIRELGLYSGNDTMMARKTCVPIAKASSFALTFLWRIRVVLTFWFGVFAAIMATGMGS